MTPRDQLIEAMALAGIRADVPSMELSRCVASFMLSAIGGEGYVVMPKEETVEIVNAAIDVDSFKLGDISPLGFRESPQHLFARCYRAMIEAGKI